MKRTWTEVQTFWFQFWALYMLFSCLGSSFLLLQFTFKVWHHGLCRAPTLRRQPPSCHNKGCTTEVQSISYALPPPQQLRPGDKTLKGSCKLGDFLVTEAIIWPSGVPDPQLVWNITAQAETYFSNENLAQDAFLLKHLQKSKLGFVSFKLLISFKKVKHLTRDWHLTCYALHSSVLLEVNQNGTKVHRRIPIPNWLFSPSHTKLLLVWERPEPGFPKEAHVPGTTQPAGFLAAVSSLCGPSGALISIRVLRPGKKLTLDVLAYTASCPELLHHPCALVQFESVEAAGQAFTTLQEDPRGFHVVRLAKRSPCWNGTGVEENSTTLAHYTSSKAKGSKAALSSPSLLGPLPHQDTFLVLESQPCSTPAQAQCELPTPWP